MELLPFVDILKVFNNPINEEQAWAVCYQCAHFLYRNQKQEYYQDVYDYGIHSIWVSRDGDVLIRKGPPEPNGSGKGPPHDSHSQHTPSSSHTVLPKRNRQVIATEHDSVQALGAAIFEALDYGIDASEERQLSHGLETLIVTMTNADNSLEYDPEAPNADDEGIEKDADIEHRCTVHDVLKLCSQHLSSKQDAHHHYKAVCRALATEAGELFTFLEKIADSKEKLSGSQDEDSKRLVELRRTDWACLWVQVMRSLRQGVLLKKVEHINLPPLEYELTPFEMLLEDIRSRRYTLHKIMVNGDIPPKVKNDAHVVILDFIRSRPPLKKVDDRKLKPKPPSPPDPHQLLLREIQSRPKLRPIKHGKLVVQSPRSRLNSDEDQETSQPVKKVIKPDLNLLLNNSFEESSEDEESSREPSITSSPLSQLSPVNGSMTPPSTSWQRTILRDSLLLESGTHRPSRLQRRHTIMVCEAPMDGKVPTQELPPLEEEEEPSPVRESHLFSYQPVSQSLGPAMLRRASYSDHDLSSQVTLRNTPGHGRRASLEHRRSLTSLTSELCAIPEMDDGPGGADSPTKSAASVRRSWSHEQAPPPNPSPPCKGRARAALGMTGMKPVGGPYLPRTHHQHAAVSSSSSSSCPLVPHTSPSGMKSDSVHSSPSTFSAISNRASSKHAANISSSSSSSSSSSLSSPALASPSSNQHVSLDPAASSQSPVYYKNSQILAQGPSEWNGASSVEDSGFARRIGKWRQLRAREERLNRRQGQILEGPERLENDVFDHGLPNRENERTIATGGEPHSRRLSLESGVSVYTDTNDLNLVSDPDQLNTPSRRLSLGVQARARGIGRELHSPEEWERMNRWKSLQEEELYTSRIRKIGRDMTAQPSVLAREPTEQNGQYPLGRASGIEPGESTDVLQQKMADEEVRFARWRRLEETGGPVYLPRDESPSTDQDYVSDVLSARLHPSTFVNSITHPALQGVMSLPKHWQNPMECLSLTLEEVTHIRSVLTKAELESLISHPDLYQQVSKNKMCFTCKTTRFTLFGEWGTKCKFCKRTVCTKCLRKMNVPTDHFRNIPVYTLSPTPLTPEMQEIIQTIVKCAPPVSVPPTRDTSPTRHLAPSQPPQNQQEQQHSTSSTPHQEEGEGKTPASKGIFGRSRQPLHRSQSLLVPGQKHSPVTSKTIKGPLMAICCDCKGMVMEIIRASRASLTMLSATTSPASSTAAKQTKFSPLRTTGLNQKKQ